jgi:hypothetical protein
VSATAGRSPPPVTTIEELRRHSVDAVLDPESLLHIPLVMQAFSDRRFRFIPRSTDVRWTYRKRVPIKLAGFNPFEFACYYGQESRFAAWLRDPFGSARELNEGDVLVKEVLFMVHDYLHAWAYSVIDQLFPRLRVLHGGITAETFDDYVFCHLLSESVATVGLDYWLLSQRDVDGYCPIGGNVGPLTVSYREALLSEYRRFSPELEIQTPDFFRMHVQFYCTGELPGFEADDLMRSPKLLDWLKHELSYGATQRRLTRQWLALLAEQPTALAEDALNAPVATDVPARQAMIEEIGRLLWAKVKGGDRSTDLVLPASPPARRAPEHKPPDFRFVNIAHVPEAQWLQAAQPDSLENFQYFFHQFLGQIPITDFPERLLKRLPWLAEQRDASLVLDLLGRLPRREPLSAEPRDLFIAN